MGTFGNHLALGITSLSPSIWSSVCSLQAIGLSRPVWKKPWAAWSDLVADPALGRVLYQRFPEVSFSQSYPVIPNRRKSGLAAKLSLFFKTVVSCSLSAGNSFFSLLFPLLHPVSGGVEVFMLEYEQHEPQCGSMKTHALEPLLVLQICLVWTDKLQYTATRLPIH